MDKNDIKIKITNKLCKVHKKFDRTRLFTESNPSPQGSEREKMHIFFFRGLVRPVFFKLCAVRIVWCAVGNHPIWIFHTAENQMKNKIQVLNSKTHFKNSFHFKAQRILSNIFFLKNWTNSYERCKMCWYEWKINFQIFSF